MSIKFGEMPLLRDIHEHVGLEPDEVSRLIAQSLGPASALNLAPALPVPDHFAIGFCLAGWLKAWGTTEPARNFVVRQVRQCFANFSGAVVDGHPLPGFRVGLLDENHVSWVYRSTEPDPRFGQEGLMDLHTFELVAALDYAPITTISVDMVALVLRTLPWSQEGDDDASGSIEETVPGPGTTDPQGQDPADPDG
jgi:hypothetical protein